MLFLILVVFMGAVSASDDINDTVVISQADDSVIQPVEDIQYDENSSGDDLLQSSDEDDLSDDGGEFIDVSEAYTYLNSFRCEEGVWQWNNDDTTKTYFNTNDTIWLYPMVRDVELEETAKIRAKELYKSFSHTRPDGTDCFTAFPDGLSGMGENIAVYYPSCESVTEAWKETDDPYEWQGHRRNMLNPDFNRVGIAGYKVNGNIYWVQDFGTRYDPSPVDSINVFSIEGNQSSYPKFKINLPIYATGYFIVKLNGHEVMRKSIFQGKSDIIIYGLNAGVYDVELSYAGDRNYEPINGTDTINVTGDESPTASFTYLNTLLKLADDEVKLQKDYSFDEAMDSEFKEGIVVFQGITIDGQGHTIDAKGQAQIFHLFEGGTLKNIKFINGVAKYHGGAVLSYAKTNLENCTFINNSAPVYGGALYAAGRLFCYDSNFTDNKAGNLGGALFGEALVEVHDSSFINNQAGNLAGAIYAQGTLYNVNTNYVNNTNLQRYSPQFIFGEGNILDDEYSLIFANVTQNNSVVNLDNDLIATQTILINASNVVINGNGHTIDAQNKTRIFFITGNNITIRNITLVGGNSIGEGGAVYARSADISIIDSTIKNSSAETGAAVSVYGNIFICSSRFIDNTASAGGAIFSDKGNVTVIDSLFKNNDAIVYGGGAIYATAKVNITGSVFTDNDAKLYGGVLYTWEDVSVISSNFTDNDAGDSGGAFFVYKGNTSIQNSNFINNSAKKSGGAISSTNIKIADSSFKNNDNGQTKTFSGNVAGNNSEIIENGKDVTSSYIKGADGQNGSGDDSGNGSGSGSSAIDSNTPSKETKITKKATKITAKKKTFKAKAKTKKYAITLTAGGKPVKKVKVYLKIKGKTFKATTNSKGKATFKIKFNKKGTFKSTITFKGDKYYNKSSKTIKIKFK